MSKIAFLLCVATMAGNTAFAADKSLKPAESRRPPELSKEQRQKMADLHEQMAVCLRSDKALPDCRQEMMKGCKDAMGKEGCPMAQGKMHGHGMMGHGQPEPGESKE